MGQARQRSTGVTIGKFNPPHLGHVHLIQQAARQVDELYVILCDRAGQTISAEERLAWLQDAAPSNTTVIVTPDDLPESSEPWARRTLDILPVRPDYAFTSEAWGPDWAALMGAKHVLVDLERVRFPISAAKIRADLSGNFHWLVPAARAALARRVVIVGAESTGKSTMAQSLARELRTVWVPEHGRWYWEGRRYLDDQSWTSDEFRRIAAAQCHLAEDLARRASAGVVVLDTDALVTAVWHERYMGAPDPELEDLLPRIAPNLYLVCCPDFAWVQDGTRESERHRVSMHEAVVARAKASRRRVEMLKGSHEERLVRALELVRPLLAFPPMV